MDNVDPFGEPINFNHLDVVYLLDLQEQLSEVLENKQNYPDSSIRALKAKIRLLKNKNKNKK